MLRDIFSDNGFLTPTAGGHKLYHDIIERYTDVEDIATGGSRTVIGSFAFTLLAVGMIMVFV